MADLTFEIQVKWSGTGKDGEGEIKMDNAALRCSAPENMGGAGVGASPEDLLISAVSTCYSGTFFRILTRSELPVQSIEVRAEGIVADFPAKTKFSRLIVHPTIIGGDQARQADYEKAAVTARDHCFIGKSIAGNISYEVGEVNVI